MILFYVQYIFIKRKLVAILYLVHCNPRPISLLDNLEELQKVFKCDELYNLLYLFCFTFENTLSLEELRKNALDWNEMYRFIGLFAKLELGNSSYAYSSSVREKID